MWVYATLQRKGTGQIMLRLSSWDNLQLDRFLAGAFAEPVDSILTFAWQFVNAFPRCAKLGVLRDEYLIRIIFVWGVLRFDAPRLICFLRRRAVLAFRIEYLESNPREQSAAIVTGPMLTKRSASALWASP
jgi:hypothetical protein